MAHAQALRVRRFVERLDRDDRYIVMLYYADGLTHVEIARLLNLPSMRVRERLESLRSGLEAAVACKPATASTGEIAAAAMPSKPYTAGPGIAAVA